MCAAQAICESDSPNFSSHKAVKPLGFTFLRFSEAIGRPFLFNKYFRIFKFFLKTFCKTFGLFKTNLQVFNRFSFKKRGWFRSTGARRRKLRRQGNYNC
jgi:hypothetical protein